MKFGLLVAIAATVGLFTACETAPKNDAKGAAATAPAAKAGAKAGAKAEPAKAGKKFEDEDISKTKPTAKTEGVAAEKITCISGGDTRTLEMSSGDGKVCRLNYTKAGETKEVASAAADPTKCNEVRDRIKGNLEGAGFKCE